MHVCVLLCACMCVCVFVCVHILRKRVLNCKMMELYLYVLSKKSYVFLMWQRLHEKLIMICAEKKPCDIVILKHRSSRHIFFQTMFVRKLQLHVKSMVYCFFFLVLTWSSKMTLWAHVMCIRVWLIYGVFL